MRGKMRAASGGRLGARQAAAGILGRIFCVSPFIAPAGELMGIAKLTLIDSLSLHGLVHVAYNY